MCLHENISLNNQKWQPSPLGVYEMGAAEVVCIWVALNNVTKSTFEASEAKHDCVHESV